MLRLVSVCAMCALLPTSPALAQSASPVTGYLDVRLQITGSCEVSGASSTAGNALIDYGTHTNLNMAIDADTGTGANAFQIKCSPGVSWTAAFDGGQSGDISARQMAGTTTPTNLIGYQLATNASMTPNLESISGSGTGEWVSYQIFGRVPAQSALPQVDTYTDRVTITVTF